MRARLSVLLLALLAILGCSKSEDGGSVPIIVQFIPAKANVNPGGSTLLVANFLGGTATVDQGVGPILSGTPISVSPTKTTTYTLTVTGSKGDTALATTTVTVGARALDISPSQVILSPGGSQAFSALVTGVSPGTVTWFAEQGTIDALGNHVAPATAGTYLVSATSTADKTLCAKAVVTVVPGPPVVVGPVLPANPVVTAGASRTFTATATGGTTNLLTWSASAGTMNPATGVWTAPATPQTVTITATSAENPFKSASTQVTVVPAPVITAFAATPGAIAYGAGSTLTYTFTGGTGSIDQGVGAVVSGGSTPTGALTATRTYTLSVVNAAGTTVSQVVTVSVSPVAVGPLTPAAPTVSVGGTRTFSTTVTGGVSNAVTWSASAGTINPGTGAWTAPATPQAVTIQATSTEDPTKSAATTVTVVALPAITLFTLRDIGSAAPLWVFDATYAGGTGSIDRGVGPIASGAQVPLGGTPLDVYTLTVTNAAGDSVTRTASAVQLAIESPSDPSSLLPGQKLTVLTSVFNATDTSVTFSAAGGTITPGGVFTAPLAVRVCTITVATVADPTVTATLTVNVTPLVYPLSQVVAPGASFQFQAAVLAAPSSAVTWTLNPATAGTISADGLFTSNGTTGFVTITATSVAFPTLSADAFVTVQPSFTYANVVTATTGTAITTRRTQHALTRIETGPGSLVLASGGLSGGVPTASLALFNPSGQFWSDSSVSLVTPRSRHTATMLPTGAILIAGGRDAAGNPLASAEVYDPSSDTLFPAPGPLGTAREDHTATLMADGRVLIAGGRGPAGTLASLEIYDPATNAFSPVPTAMADPRVGHVAERLADGRIFLGGGSRDGTDANLSASADLFNPATGALVATTGAMNFGRRNMGSVLGANGLLSLLGGVFTPSVPILSNGGQRFDPTPTTYTTLTSAMSVPRNRPMMTILADGNAVILGGSSDFGVTGDVPGTAPINTLDVYNPLTTVFPVLGTNIPGVGFDALQGRCLLLSDGTVLIVGDVLNGAGAPVGSVVYQ